MIEVEPFRDDHSIRFTMLLLFGMFRAGFRNNHVIGLQWYYTYEAQ